VEYALSLLILGMVVAAVVLAPLRGGRASRQAEGPEVRLADLEAAREATYREIREAELDFRMGKLSRLDFEKTDGELRGRAVEIMRELDALAEPAARR